MSNKPLASVTLAATLLVALIVAIVVTLAISVSVLPAAPGAATPTWPQGIDLPDKLPRLP